LQTLDRRSTRQSDIALALLEHAAEIDLDPLYGLTLALVDGKGPRKDERDLIMRNSSKREGQLGTTREGERKMLAWTLRARTLPSLSSTRNSSRVTSAVSLPIGVGNSTSGNSSASGADFGLPPSIFIVVVVVVLVEEVLAAAADITFAVSFPSPENTRLLPSSESITFLTTPSDLPRGAAKKPRMRPTAPFTSPRWSSTFLTSITCAPFLSMRRSGTIIPANTALRFSGAAEPESRASYETGGVCNAARRVELARSTSWRMGKSSVGGRSESLDAIGRESARKDCAASGVMQPWRSSFSS